MSQSQQKKEWITPRAERYGSVKEITRSMKSKTYGGGDDVMIDDQAILANLGS